MFSNSYSQSSELLTHNLKTNTTKYEAKVVPGVLNMRKQPQTNSKVIQKLFEGDLLSVLETNGKWKKVKFETVTGWVHSNYISTVNKSEIKPARPKNVELKNRSSLSEADAISQLQRNMSRNDVRKLFAEPDIVKKIIDHANRHEICIYKLKNRRLLHLRFINNHLNTWQISTLQNI